MNHVYYHARDRPWLFAAPMSHYLKTTTDFERKHHHEKQVYEGYYPVSGTADYNFSRLPASFRESDAQGVRAALTEIRDSANQISQRMYRALDQNRNPRGKEQER